MRALALVLLVAALAPAAGASSSTTYWHGYTGAPVGAYCHGLVQAGDCPSLTGTSVQFGPFAASSADLQVRDDTGRRVGASYAFYSADGDELAAGSFCGGASGIVLPAGATYVVVDVDSPLTAQHCGLASEGVNGYVMLRTR